MMNRLALSRRLFRQQRSSFSSESESTRTLEVLGSGALAFGVSASLVIFLPSEPATLMHFKPVEQDMKLSVLSDTLNINTPFRIPEEKQKTLAKDGGRRVYDVSSRAIRGGRVTMEDEYYVADGGRFAAVFDGHGGGGVSQYLKKHLYGYVTTYLKEAHEAQADHTDVPKISSLVAALRRSFQRVEDEVVQDNRLQYQGSTAVAVMLHEMSDGHRCLVSANVGDSRAILSRHGRAVDLTRDHKPNEDREKQRILSMGEEIEWDSLAKVHRVRNLSLSRAIGDRYAKPVVTAEVEIQKYMVDEEKDEFILLASDGLWDVMTSQEVVSYVHRRMERELEGTDIAKADRENYKVVLRRSMAKFVAREAFRRGSGDNICILLVWLNDNDA